MKKYALLLTFVVFLLCTPVFVHADFTFYKAAENPLPVHTTFEGWIQKGIYQPSIIHDNNGYRMWYASAGESAFAIAYATSTDGIHWNSDNLLRLSTSGSSIYNPFAVPSDNGFTVFFSIDEPEKKARLMSITQHADGTYNKNTVAEVLGPTELWESNGLFGPFVVSENGKSFLFYSAWGNQGFKIGMATAGVNGLEKCSNNPVITDGIADSPHILEKDGIKYLFYHSGEGIRAISSTDPYSCTMHWSTPKTVLTPGPEAYDSNLMIAPSVLMMDDTVALYYSGLGPNGWTLNMAAATQPNTKLHPVVFVPGLFASWNKNALLYNVPAQQTDWVLNPSVREYDGILETMKNLGYKQNTDFYVFNYDWRKGVNTITSELNTFMESVVKPAHGNDIRLLGHSLGGLVARMYMQKYHPSYISNLVTVGSPHKGAALSYKAAAGGDIEATNTFEWLMQKLLVQTYRNGLVTDRQIMQEHLPIIQDLLPVYGSYLKQQDGSTIPLSSMSVQNTLLNNNISSIPAQTVTNYITGVGVDTIQGYTVTTRSVYDKLLNLYPDGRPVNTNISDGDGIVPALSALADSVAYTGDHGEIIYRKDHIASVLNALQIPFNLTKITEGRKTGISPSIIFLVFSPVTLKLHHGSHVYAESDGMLFMERPTNGEYTLKATGTGNGPYTILMGQVTENTIIWNKIEGQITAIVPSSQVDTYNLYVDTKKPLMNPLNIPGSTIGLDMFLKKLKAADGIIGHKKLIRTIHLAYEAKRHLDKGNTQSAQQRLFIVMKMLYDTRKKDTDVNRKIVLELVTDLQSLMIDMFKNSSPGYTAQTASAAYHAINLRFEQTQQQLIHKLQHQQKMIVPAGDIEHIKRLLDSANTYISELNLKAVEVMLFSAQKAIETL